MRSGLLSPLSMSGFKKKKKKIARREDLCILLMPEIAALSLPLRPLSDLSVALDGYISEPLGENRHFLAHTTVETFSSLYLDFILVESAEMCTFYPEATF